MPVLIPPGYGKCNQIIQLTGDSEPMMLTYGVGPDLGGDQDPVAVANRCQSSAVAWRPFMSNVYSFIRCELYYRPTGADDDSPFEVAISTGPAVVGADASGPVPQNSAVLFHKRTARAGRQGRGRLYVPGVVEAGVTATGTYIGDASTAIAAAGAIWLTHFDSAPSPIDGMGVYLFHGLANGELFPKPPDKITSVSSDPLIATQRRRLR